MKSFLGVVRYTPLYCIQQHYEPFTAQRLCTDGSAKRQKASARPAHKRQQAKNPRGLQTQRNDGPWIGGFQSVWVFVALTGCGTRGVAVHSSNSVYAASNLVFLYLSLSCHSGASWPRALGCFSVLFVPLFILPSSLLSFFRHACRLLQQSSILLVFGFFHLLCILPPSFALALQDCELMA